MLNKFVLSLLLVVSIGLFVVIVDPIYKQNKVLVKEREKLSEALDKARELEAASQELEDKVKSISPEDYERLHRLLPDHVDNVRLILDIDQIANRYGLTIKKLEFSAEKDVQGNKVEVVETQRSPYARPVDEGGGEVATTRVGPVEEVSLQSLTFQFTISAPYSQFLLFLRDLEKSLRLVDIVGIKFSSDEADFYDFDVKIATYWLG